MDRPLKSYSRALRVLDDVCIGCSHCIKVCPTEVLRISDGKAYIHEEWCIDCGECFRTCPSRAIRVMEDDYERVADYRYKILLVPQLFFGMFEDRIPRETLYGLIGHLGFTEICTVEQSVDALAVEINKYLDTADDKPVISSYCPAVVRLIQIRFPFFVDNILRLKPPLELTAHYYENRFRKEGIPLEDVGIFYLTPCIAKIASVKAPVGGYKSPITGVLNMDSFYNRVYLAYKQKAPLSTRVKVNRAISSDGVLYPTTGGEAKLVKARTLAIDGMNNVIDFLELLENGKVNGVDYLELRACDQSCAGGILSHRNRFIVAENMRKYARSVPLRHELFDDYRKFVPKIVKMDAVEARTMVKYDRNIEVALKKMENARLLRDILPNIDCGACGAPSCEALAEDIVREQNDINACIFLRTILEKRGELSLQDANSIMERIWGKDRFNGDSK